MSLISDLLLSDHFVQAEAHSRRSLALPLWPPFYSSLAICYMWGLHRRVSWWLGADRSGLIGGRGGEAPSNQIPGIESGTFLQTKQKFYHWNLFEIRIDFQTAMISSPGEDCLYNNTPLTKVCLPLVLPTKLQKCLNSEFATLGGVDIGPFFLKNCTSHFYF